MISYRPDIDGLRAIAILPVIFFHAGFSLFGGGFVGVDIFFVISGFLITSILLTNIQETNTLQITKFYERRARRILPALYAILIFCTFYGVFFLSPFASRDLFQSILATTLFLENFLLVFESSNYFAYSSELKPLMHTWSLSIEEQFYVFAPFFLLLITKIQKISLEVIVLISILILFAGNIVFSQNEYLFGFYSLLGRSWELLAGSFLAIYTFDNKKKNYNLLHSNIMSILGLMLILGSIIFLDENSRNLRALLIMPVIGTALIILFSHKRSFVYKLLSSKSLVFIGLISFSLYLWHQPLFAIAKIELGSQLSNEFLMFLIFLTFLMSIFSYHFLEKPFRDPQIISTKPFILITLFFSIFFICIGFVGHQTKGFESAKLSFMTHEEEKLYVNHFNLHAERDRFEIKLYKKNDENLINPQKTIFLIGDSMASDTALAYILKGYKINRVILDGTCFEELVKLENSCNASLKDILEKSENSTLTILSSDWSGEGSSKGGLMLYQFLENNQINVMVVGALRFSHFSDSSFKYLTRNYSYSIDKFLYKRIDPRSNYSNDIFNKIPKEKFINKLDLFCNKDNLECLFYNESSQPIFFDELHLTVEGLHIYSNFLPEAH
jgi:peptidoglycan/LPS O-acetylase OafA/YrhL